MSERLQLLESVLGQSHKANGDYYQFKCPFHVERHGPKLGISLGTGKWKCWVCNTHGSSISNLFYKLETDSTLIRQAKNLFAEKVKFKKTEFSNLQLPNEFNPLWIRNEKDFFWKKAKSYLLGRGVTEKDIIKHRIGYCTSGKFGDMVIFPSYNSNGRLVFFSGRSYLPNPKYKFSTPGNIDKDIIFDENLTNWSDSLILVESKLDAIIVRRNVIPLNGKQLCKELIKKILQNCVERIYLCLDGDALEDIMQHAAYFIEQGIEVYKVELPFNEDPTSLGYERVWEYIKNAKSVTKSDLFEYEIFQKLMQS